MEYPKIYNFKTPKADKIGGGEKDVTSERWKRIELTDQIIDQDIEISSHGKIYLKVENKDGTTATMAVKNKVLLTGRAALAASLANQYNGEFPFYIARVLFGSNGTLSGNPKFVEDTREGLFGVTTLTKPVIASIDTNLPQQVTFTTTVTFSELVGQVINEMALEMANGQLFSMATFGDINKSSSMQLIWNWRLTWV